MYIWEFFWRGVSGVPKWKCVRDVASVYYESFIFLSLCSTNNRLCVARTFSHMGQGDTYTLNSPRLIFTWGWLGTTKSEDKKQLSIQNSQLGYTQARNSPANDWAERQLDPGNHLGSRKGGKKKHIQQMNQRSSSPQYVWRKAKTFRKGKKGKRNNFEMNCQVHQKTQEHLYNKYCKTKQLSSFHGKPIQK